MHALDPLFRPRSVAVIGASHDPNKVGGRPIAFLRRAGWSGRIVAVNGKGGEVQGLRAFATLAAADTSIDQAIVAVPAAQVHEAVAEALAAGAKALQVFSAGFGEGDPVRAADDTRRLAAAARAGGARLLGPNSLGLFNAVDGYFGTFATALDGAWPKAGGVGVATQSGAFGSYFFGLAERRGLAFSHFVATGNEADVDVADCVDFLAADPATRIVVCAIEGCRDGRKLVRAIAGARAAGKPVLAMKVGASAAGARAAATHTGALAGADRVFAAALAGAGAWRADSLDALVDAACAASTTACPRGRRTLVVTTSGGIGVLAADAAEAHGLSLPTIPPDAVREIAAIAPLAGGANPVDTSAGILGDLAAYARIADRALAAAGFDAVLCFVAHIARNPDHWAQLRGPLVELRLRHPELAFAVVGLADEPVRTDLAAQGFAVFDDPSRAVAALAACASFARAADLNARDDAPAAGVDTGGGDGLDDVATETGAKRFLAARGIAFATEAPVADADAAVRAARRIGYPVALKVVSPDIAHKTEAGGVVLGIPDDRALHREIGAMRTRVAARRPDARIEGFLVSRQLDGGVELIVGTQRDPSFGPVIGVGAGGVLAELIDETTLRLAPVSEREADAMIDGTRVGRLLAGWRGAPAADRRALVTQIVRLSRIAAEHADRIEGIELNPVLARHDGAVALDALIVAAGRHPEQRP